jgi:hypothetical protein
MVIEANCGDGVLFECAIGDRFYKGGFAGILEADDGDFEFFVEEFGLDPGKDFVDEGKHLFESVQTKTYYYE